MPKMLKLLTICLCVSNCVSGKPIKWNPDAYWHDDISQSIENADHKKVYCSEREFNDFISISKEKLKELNEILIRARLPKIYEKNRQDLLAPLLR